MAAFVTETFATEALAATTLTVTPANTAGNLLVLCIGCRPGTITFGVADTGGNTWAQATIRGSTAIWYSLTTAIAGTVTVTASASATMALSCLEFSGIGASPLDVAFSGASATTNAPATGTSAATSQADEVVVAFIQQNNATAVFSAQTAGYTVNPMRVSTGTGSSNQSAYQILAATGTQAYAAASSGSSTWTAILATFKASTGSTIALSASVVSTSSVAATTSLSVALGAALTSTSAVAATSSQTIALSAAIASTSAVSATVSTGTQIALSAAISSNSSVAAAVTQTVAVSASISSASSLSASTTKGIALTATIASMSAVSGAVTVLSIPVFGAPFVVLPAQTRSLSLTGATRPIRVNAPVRSLIVTAKAPRTP